MKHELLLPDFAVVREDCRGIYKRSLPKEISPLWTLDVTEVNSLFSLLSLPMLEQPISSSLSNVPERALQRKQVKLLLDSVIMRTIVNQPINVKDYYLFSPLLVIISIAEVLCAGFLLLA